MRTVRTGMVVGLIAQLLLLTVLDVAVSLGPLGWTVGIAVGLVTNVALARGLTQAGASSMGPADRVTLTRATLVGGVTALVADSFVGDVPVPLLVALTAVALVLDAVDGQVARRTGTVSKVGARFDMEVDAFLILVLSIDVAPLTGQWWVLAMGAARYGFVAAGWLLPWMRGTLPPRRWRKVVAAVQGIVLMIAASDVLPRGLTTLALAVALALLAESFGRDVWWLWRHRTVGAIAVVAAQEGAAPDNPVPVDAAKEGAAPENALPVAAARESVVPGDAIRASGGDGPRHRASGVRGPVRIAAAWAATVGACALVWFALVAPNHYSALAPAAFLRIPLEGVLVIVLVLLLPRRSGGFVAVLVGAILGVLTLLKILDMGFFATLDRPFNPVTDWPYLASAVGLATASVGRAGAVAAVVAAVVLSIAVIVLMPLSMLRLTRLTGRHRVASFRSASALGGGWLLCALLGVQIVAGAPVASTSAVDLTIDQLSQVREGILDQEKFADAVAADRFGGSVPSPVAAIVTGTADGTGTSDAGPSVGIVPAAGPATAAPLGQGATPPSVVPPSPAAPTAAPAATPAGGLLNALKGKDVIIAFVEAYGRIAVQDSTFSPQVDATLDAGTSTLRDAGFSARSAFLTSPTFGGLSWLAHSTFQSGLWIDNEQRYDQLIASDRLTLTGAFKNAGWRTVAGVPANEKAWPEGATFYHYDQIYDGSNFGYTGPGFSYAPIPDQYTLHAFQQMELAQPDRGPVMAEIDLVSSHWPWAPLPHLIDWNQVDNGPAFQDMPLEGESRDVIWSDPNLVKAAYAQSIEYTLNTLVSFVQTYADDNLVMIVLGDHEPVSAVSGEGTTHDVPISILAHDPAVLDRISGWGWQDGLRPGPQAPLWPMDSFRDRFLTAYSP